MSNEILFAVPFPVVPKQRPRRGKHGFYTPSKTKRCERDISILAGSARSRYGLWAPMDGDVAVAIGFPMGLRGDVDNLGKTVLDAMNGILYHDDRQVVKLCVHRLDGKETIVTVAGVGNGQGQTRSRRTRPGSGNATKRQLNRKVGKS